MIRSRPPNHQRCMELWLQAANLTCHAGLAMSSRSFVRLAKLRATQRSQAGASMVTIASSFGFVRKLLATASETVREESPETGRKGGAIEKETKYRASSSNYYPSHHAPGSKNCYSSITGKPAKQLSSSDLLLLLTYVPLISLPPPPPLYHGLSPLISITACPPLQRASLCSTVHHSEPSTTTQFHLSHHSRIHHVRFNLHSQDQGLRCVPIFMSHSTFL